jgi:hypothetical protein
MHTTQQVNKQSSEKSSDLVMELYTWQEHPVVIIIHTKKKKNYQS